MGNIHQTWDPLGNSSWTLALFYMLIEYLKSTSYSLCYWEGMWKVSGTKNGEKVSSKSYVEILLTDVTQIDLATHSHTLLFPKRNPCSL